MKPINPWYALPHQMLKCPVPGCEHTASIITKVHCRDAHKVDRAKIGKDFGYPKIVEMKKVKVND